MAVKALEWAWEQDIPRSERDVLMVLANAINKDHEFAFPSQEAIAKKVRMSERHVRRLIKALEDRGLVRTMAGPGKGRGRAPTRYFLAVDHMTGETRDLTEGAKCPPVGSQPDPTARPPCPPVGSQPDKGCPVHKKEPEGRPSKVEAKHQTSAQGDGLTCKQAVALFAEAADRCNWVRPKAPHSKARQAAIFARLKEHKGAGWREQIAIAETMPFLGGDNDRGWRMSLDWFIKPANWTKIAEGAYAKSKPAKRAIDADEWRRRIENFRFDGSWSASYGPRPGQAGYLGPPLKTDPQQAQDDGRHAA